MIQNIWNEKLEKNVKWYKPIIESPKRCNGYCCKNPRKNKWIVGTHELSKQELKNLDDTKSQIELL